MSIGKKGMIGETANWIVATLIVFFILVVYTAALASLVVRGDVTKKDVSVESLSIQINIINFLKSSKETSEFGIISFREFMINSLAPYAENEQFMKTYLKENGVNELYKYTLSKPRKLLIMVGEDSTTRENELREKIAEYFNGVCSEYILITPFGAVVNSVSFKMSPTTFKNPAYFDEGGNVKEILLSKFQPWTEFNLYYLDKTGKVHKILLKYTQSNKC